MLTRRFKFKILTVCRQFFVQDETAEDVLDWTKEEAVRLLAIKTKKLGIGTVCDMYVPVDLEITSAEPKHDDFGEWDQVNECSLKIASGKLIVTGIGDQLWDVPRRFNVIPGSYRVRIYYGELGSVKKTKVKGKDQYKLVLWKSRSGPLIVQQHVQTTSTLTGSSPDAAINCTKLRTTGAHSTEMPFSHCRRM
jgi:hypothetical protein